jgi:hypothetical protein
MATAAQLPDALDQVPLDDDARAQRCTLALLLRRARAGF